MGRDEADHAVDVDSTLAGDVRSLVAEAGSGWLVTVGVDGEPSAALVPLDWTGETLTATFDQDHPQWQRFLPGSTALIICQVRAPERAAVQISGALRVVDAELLESANPALGGGRVDERVRIEVTVRNWKAVPDMNLALPAASTKRVASSSPSRPAAPVAEDPSPTEIASLFLQLLVYLSVAIWAMTQFFSPLARIVGVVGGVAFMAISWGLFASTKARFPLTGPARVGFEVLWFGAGVVALWVAGQVGLAVIIAAAAILNGVARFVMWRRSSASG